MPVGLYTNNEAEFRADPDGTARDLVAPGIQNVFICEVGSAQLNGTFEEFTAVLEDSQVMVLENVDILLKIIFIFPGRFLFSFSRLVSNTSMRMDYWSVFFIMSVSATICPVFFYATHYIAALGLSLIHI